jgi:amino acid adenylation domain-containing protein
MAYLLQQLLTKSAAQYPDKNAVWARGQSLTYRELDEASNRLSHLLRQSGLRKGDRVGLFFPKCVESLVAMFAALKAGAVYVPLDPSAPADRIGYIMRDCGIKTLITNDAKLQLLDDTTVAELRCVVLTEESSTERGGVFSWSSLGGFPPSYPADVSGIETDLAYILYTSGSTGRPKGVMLSHRNALTFVDWCAATFQVHDEDRLSNHAPLHFDLSVFDVYNAVEAGATVYLVTEDLAYFPTTLAKFIRDHKLTIWYSVPSALSLLLLHANLTAEHLECLRIVLFAGEVFPMKYLRQLAELVPGADLYNLYGPTETNVCTYYKVERPRLAHMDRLPIGIACENTEVFAVDDQGQIAKPGAVGELLVRGPSVTPGYWGDPEKTKRACVPNVHQPNFEEKAYRTGDMVSLADDGNYYYLGRRDNMIKSRGYRIELGEIESVLLSHPEVKEAAVIAIPDPLIGNRIKAVVAAHTAGSLKQVDLQQYCSTRVPQYMVPESIEFHESLPKTSTGKVDRVRLAGAATAS